MKKKSQPKTAASPAKRLAKKSGKNSEMPAVAEHLETYIEDSNHPSHLRRGAVTISEVRELADFLLSQAQNFNGIAKSMEKLAMPSLDRVDGITKGNRGKKLIAEFAANLNRAFTDQQFGV